MTDSDTINKVLTLVAKGEFKISEHALEELIEDDLGRSDVIDSIATADLLENYPYFRKGPAVLLLQEAADGRIIHTVWGIPRGYETPAVLITVYEPDPERWDSTFKVRK